MLLAMEMELRAMAVYLDLRWDLSLDLYLEEMLRVTLKLRKRTASIQWHDDGLIDLNK